jgi:hypothetical protein
LYGVGLVKDEADVLEQSIRHALGFCDRIFYMDNGSVDDSWAILCHLAQRHPGRVVPFERTAEPYVEGMRNRIVNELAAELGPDGWWLKLDADEFLDSDPRPKIASASATGRDSIRCWQVQFAFTDVDLAEWEAGRDDRCRPIEQRRRYYQVDWREVRLWRNMPDRRWENMTLSHPEFIQNPTRTMLLNRHYQYRDPTQIQRRLDVRHGNRHFPHEALPDWQSVVQRAADLNLSVEGQPFQFSRFNYYRTVLPDALRSRAEASGVPGVQRLARSSARLISTSSR